MAEACETLGQRIRARRKELGMTLCQAAKLCRYHMQHLFKLESGKTPVCPHALAHIGEVLGIEFEPPKSRLCPACGLEFATKKFGHQKVYCSQKCYRKSPAERTYYESQHRRHSVAQYRKTDRYRLICRERYQRVKKTDAYLSWVYCYNRSEYRRKSERRRRRGLQLTLNLIAVATLMEKANDRNAGPA